MTLPTDTRQDGRRVPEGMRRAVAEPLVGIRLEDAPVPRPEPDQVLVRSSLVGICGSDIHALAGQHPFLASTYLPGHEATGVVAGLGSAVSGIAVGQRVLLKPNVACGRCVNCLADRSNACERLTWIGCDPSGRWAGAMADYFVAPASNAYPVPDEVDDPTAALVECLATPVHAVRIAGDVTGARVVVLGAGTIGLLCVVAALQAGAGTVVVTDMDEGKLARAARVGAHGGVLASSPDADAQVAEAVGGPADVVLDCVASARSFAQAVGLLRRAGTLVVVGVPARDALLPMPVIQDREIRVQGSAAYTEADVRAAIAIAVAGGIPTAEVVSGTYGLDEVAGAFAAATADSTGKLLIAL
jgi:threonine dehydrogenase-like Zn-dependent dehydrogenase